MLKERDWYQIETDWPPNFGEEKVDQLQHLNIRVNKRSDAKDPTPIEIKNDTLCKGDVAFSLERMIIRVAERTRAVDQLIYFPIITLMLILLARIQYFDNLGFPVSSGIVYTVSILLLLYVGLQLRGEAGKLRSTVIESIENNLTYPYTKKEKEKFIQKINNANLGAFQPMMEQPTVRSALLLLGAIGLFATEYIMLFGY